jgi:hypothetical protein
MKNKDYADPTGNTTDVLDSEELGFQHLGEWVMAQVDEWEVDYQTNYEQKFREYYRLWRGIWSEEDKTRESERSRLISPALQQAVESNVAEIEEATFGRGQWFDLKDNLGDEESQDVELLRKQLLRDFEKCKIRQAVGECLINSAVFGTGIAEIVLDEVEEEKPATRPMMEGQLQAYGVEFEERTVTKLLPVLPQNFRIDPAATCIEDALGVAIDRFVGKHVVEELQEKGVYFDKTLSSAAEDTNLEADPELTSPGGNNSERVRLIKYYGKVPTELLLDYIDKEELDNPDAKYTEAIVVLANGGECVLKAEKHPYMFKQDRPLVAFSWDVVPGKFWGRGVCEKGYNVQKALDVEMRARIDTLALTVAPMLAMDSTKKIPGVKYDVRPGKIWLTQGTPGDAFMPLNIGDVKQSSFAQTGALQAMLQSATGAVDSNGVSGQINGDATAAGISMSLGAIIKRHKRTLVNFQQSFLVPFVQKAAYRYMQFDPDRYPVKDYSFSASSSLGIIAREYEVTQLTQLLQTMPPDSPMYPALVEAIVDNMALSNRETLIKTLKTAAQPNPEAEAAQQAMQQAQIAFQEAQTAAISSQAQKDQAATRKLLEETRLLPMEIEVDIMRASTTNLSEGSNDEREFERRYKLAELLLKEKGVDATVENNRLTAALKERQMNQPKSPTQSKAEKALMQRLGVSGDSPEASEQALAQKLKLV